MSQKIEYKKHALGYKYTMNDQRLNLKDITILTSHIDGSRERIQKVKGLNILNQIIGGVGGFCLGYSIGSMIRGAKPDWKLVGAGAGLVLTTIPIGNEMNKIVRSVVDDYNTSLDDSALHEKPNIGVGSGQYGYGLVIQF